MNKIKILITGISGFVGNNIVKYFSNFQEYKILGLDIVFPNIVGVEKIYSWEELKVIEDIDIVIHLAGKAHDIENTSEEKSYFDINYGLTKKVYDWYLNSSATKFFMMSSVKAVTDSVIKKLTEEVVPNPITAYGKSKLKAEEYLNSMKLPKGKYLYIFRPAMIYGQGNKGNLNILYKIVSRGLPWPLGAFANKRSFFSVHNLCFVYNEFINNQYDSGTYNLADNEPVSTNELIQIISSIRNKKAQIWKIPHPIVKLIAHIGSIIRLPLNTERLRKLTENYIISNAKLLKTINKELPIKIKQGLTDTLKTFK